MTCRCFAWAVCRTRDNPAHCSTLTQLLLTFISVQQIIIIAWLLQHFYLYLNFGSSLHPLPYYMIYFASVLENSLEVRNVMALSLRHRNAICQRSIAVGRSRVCWALQVCWPYQSFLAQEPDAVTASQASVFKNEPN